MIVYCVSGGCWGVCCFVGFGLDCVCCFDLIYGYCTVNSVG